MYMYCVTDDNLFVSKLKQNLLSVLWKFVEWNVSWFNGAAWNSQFYSRRKKLRHFFFQAIKNFVRNYILMMGTQIDDVNFSF
jgi:hypothetical protein